MTTPDETGDALHDEHDSDPRSAFKADTSPRGIDGAVRDYIGRLRSGDPGGLPSVLGLLVLGITFATTTNLFLSGSAYSGNNALALPHGTTFGRSANAALLGSHRLQRLRRRRSRQLSHVLLAEI